MAKWKKRTHMYDAPMGPKAAHSTVLTTEQEAIIAAFRSHALLPLEDRLYALQARIATLTCSSLHRCLQRHDISRLPEVEGDKPAKKKFANYPIGYFHVDIAELRTEEGKLCLFVGIDRTSTFVDVELRERYGKMEAARFRHNLITAVPYHIHALLTDNGIQCTNRKKDKGAWAHIFDRVCYENQIEPRLTIIF